jgi:alcohol dehydrogenase (cytochrome c)
MIGRLLPAVLTAAAALIAALPSMAQADHGTSRGPWPTYNNAYDGQRFSSAKAITPQNVGTLKRVCEVQLGDPGSFHSGPIVIDRTLYVTTAHTTVALDAADCSIQWRHVYKPEQPEVYAVNRGVAYLDGRLFRGTGDGRVIALDASNGKQVWLTKASDPLKGEFFSSAPIAWRDLVFIGTAGSDWGVRGYVIALDAKTGREKWRFYTIPMGNETGADSWKDPKSAAHGGGGMWTSYTLDTKSGELFVPVGNPAPDFAPDRRLGANLFTDSVVVLDALTGKLKWYHQFTANDGFDYDFGAAPALYTGGRNASLMAAGSKDGHLYGIDRATHKVLFKTPVTTIKNAGARPTVEGVEACPGPLGGVEWNGPAVDPHSRAIFVGSVDYCFLLKTTSGTPEYKPGGMYFGTSQTPAVAADAARGWIHAVDGDSGNILWKYQAAAPVVAGVTPTAGGVVFSGDLSGNLFALDAKTGRELYKLDTGGAVAGGVLTYETGGKQYVATTSGNVSRMTFHTAGAPKLVILTTGLAKDEPKIVAVAKDPPPPTGGSPSDRGKALFAQNCTACHGQHAEGGVGPALTGEAAKKDTAQVVDFIKNPKAPMPKLYPAPLNDQDVADIAAFVETLK